MQVGWRVDEWGKWADEVFGWALGLHELCVDFRVRGLSVWQCFSGGSRGRYGLG